MKPGAIAHEVWELTMEDIGVMGYYAGQPKTGGAVEADPTQPEVGLYSHSVGNSTHDIGRGLPSTGRSPTGIVCAIPLQPKPGIRFELHVSTPIPEWDGKVVPIRIEENARLTDNGVEYFVPRQQELLVIGRSQ